MINEQHTIRRPIDITTGPFQPRPVRVRPGYSGRKTAGQPSTQSAVVSAVTPDKAVQITRTSPPPKKRSFWHRYELPVVIGLGMIAGLLVQSSAIGQLLILMYGIFAFVFRIESRTTFTLALMAMMTTIALFMFRNNPSLANNFSMYAFLLLIIGVVSLAWETRQLRSLYTRRRNKK